MRKSYLLMIAISLSLGSLATPCFAGTLAINLDFDAVGGGYSINTAGYWSYGWSFEVNTDILLSGLAYFDCLESPQNGLANSHAVGLFSMDRDLLISTVIFAGTSVPLLDSFRYRAVDLILLNAGRTYMIAATSPPGLNDGIAPQDAMFSSPSPGIGFTWDTQITFIDGWIESSLTDIGLVFPSKPAGLNTFFGPNFVFETIPVSEPSPLTLLAVSTLFLGLKGLCHELHKRQPDAR